MTNQLLPGLRIKLFMTVALGIAYPLAITGICQALFSYRANGSLGPNGSDLIGQSFTRPEFFHPRPSAAGEGYDAAASGGANLGPTSAKLLYGTTKMDSGKKVVDFDGLSLRLVRYCLENGIPFESSRPIDSSEDDVTLIEAFNDGAHPIRVRAASPIPADAITGSASGLDPHISPANADLQAPRVAKARGVDVRQVRDAVASATERPFLGFIGEARVNVLRLNLALERQFPPRRVGGN
jgi:K+-transporting ATPase ATPase C chain